MCKNVRPLVIKFRRLLMLPKLAGETSAPVFGGTSRLICRGNGASQLTSCIKLQHCCKKKPLESRPFRRPFIHANRGLDSEIKQVQFGQKLPACLRKKNCHMSADCKAEFSCHQMQQGLVHLSSVPISKGRTTAGALGRKGKVLANKISLLKLRKGMQWFMMNLLQVRNCL